MNAQTQAFRRRRTWLDSPFRPAHPAGSLPGRHNPTARKSSERFQAACYGRIDLTEDAAMRDETADYALTIRVAS